MKTALLVILLAVQACAGDVLVRRDSGYYLLRSDSMSLEGPLQVFDQRGGGDDDPDDPPTNDNLNAQAKKVRDFSVGVLTKEQGVNLAHIVNMLYRQMTDGNLTESGAERALDTAVIFAGNLTDSSTAYKAWLSRFKDQTTGSWKVRFEDGRNGLAAAFSVPLDSMDRATALAMTGGNASNLTDAEQALDLGTILQLIMQILEFLKRLGIL